MTLSLSVTVTAPLLGSILTAPSRYVKSWLSEISTKVYLPLESYSPLSLNSIFLNLQGGSPFDKTGICINGFGSIVKRILLFTSPVNGASLDDWLMYCKLQSPLSLLKSLPSPLYLVLYVFWLKPQPNPRFLPSWSARLAYQLTEDQSSDTGTSVLRIVFPLSPSFLSIHIDMTWASPWYLNVLPNRILDELSLSYTTSTVLKRLPFPLVGVTLDFLPPMSPISLNWLIAEEFGNLPLCITNHKKASISSALANLYESSTPSRPKYQLEPNFPNGLIDNLSIKSIDSMLISMPYSCEVL